MNKHKGKLMGTVSKWPKPNAYSSSNAFDKKLNKNESVEGYFLQNIQKKILTSFTCLQKNTHRT